MKLSRFFIFIFASFLISCIGGGSGDTTDSNGETFSKPDNNQQNSQKYGTIKVKFVSNSTASLKAQKKVVKGRLIATPDKIRLAIENALKVPQENIEELPDGTYVIKNIPPTANGSITFISNDSKEGITIDNVTLKEGETKDLGEVTLEKLYNLKIKVLSSKHKEVIINFYQLDINKKIQTGKEFIVNNLPEGLYYCLITDLNGEVLFYKSVQIPDSSELIVKLSDYIYSGVLKGRILDKYNNPVSKALIFLKPEKDDYLMTLSENNGYFEFNNLVKGTYTIFIEKDGFKPKEITNISLDEGKIIDLGNIFLEISTNTGGIIGYVYKQNKKDHSGVLIGYEKVGDNDVQTKAYTTRTDGAFVIKNLPDGEYVLNITPTEDHYKPAKIKVSVLKGQTTIIEKPVILEFFDKNPPQIKSVNITGITGEVSYDSEKDIYIMNPGNKFNIDILAQDLDGDELTYHFYSSDGRFLAIDEKTGKATFLAPEEGGYYSIVIKVKTKFSEVSETIDIYVNHKPEIEIISPNLSEITKENPKEYLANEEVIISANIYDMEDNFDDLKITWYSDLEGKIAENTSTMQKVLIPGLHKIDINVEDTKGLRNKKTVYINVKPLDIIWLKEPDISVLKIYTTQDGVALKSSYQIKDASKDKQLAYESLDTSIAQVDTSGLITAVKSGTTKIRVYSLEQDADGNPLYEYFITVRVIGDLDKETLKELSIGQIKQIRVNENNLPEGLNYIPVKLKFPYVGKYEILVFDEKDIILNTLTKHRIYTESGSASNEITGIGYHEIEVLDINDNYEIRLYPNNYYSWEKGDEFIKIAVFPSFKIKDLYPDSHKYIAWDGNYEPNDVPSTAFPVQLSKGILGDINVWEHDNVDFYILENIPKGDYLLKIKLLEGTQDNDSLFLEIIAPDGSVIEKLITGYSTKAGTYADVTFKAHEQGDYRIKIYRGGNKVTYYEFIVYPSIFNGLVHDKNGEPNDKDFLASIAYINKYITGDINIESGDIEDWYLVKNIPSDTYSFQIRLLDGTEEKVWGNKFIVEVLNQSKAVIGKFELENINPNVGDTFSFHIPHNQDIYIRVYRSDNRKAYYKFIIFPSLEKGLLQDAEGEPNDTYVMPTPISIGKEITGKINVDYVDKRDWYLLENLPPGIYSLKLEFLKGSERIELSRKFLVEIFNPDKAKIASGEFVYSTGYPGNTLVVDFEVIEQGDYRIQIYRTDYKKSYYKFIVLPKTEE